jgi:AcrR family transcriptional regulator
MPKAQILPRPASDRLGRDDWIGAARAALVAGGVAAVKVDRLADTLGVTRGSFYWHFASRAELLDALLASWAEGNSAPFLRVLNRDQDNPARQYLHFIEVWVDENEFDPVYDSAVRDWARASAKVERLVRRIDQTRMDTLRAIFARMGYDELEAEVRARVTYYHQVGYYAMHISESRELRRQLFPIYFKVLAGMPMPRETTPYSSVLTPRAGRS